MKFLILLFIIAFLIFFVFGSILTKIIRLFGKGMTNPQQQRQGYNNNQSQDDYTSKQSGNHKQFSKEEGEYVSYEEIKDDDK